MSGRLHYPSALQRATRNCCPHSCRLLSISTASLHSSTQRRIKVLLFHTSEALWTCQQNSTMAPRHRAQARSQERPIDTHTDGDRQTDRQRETDRDGPPGTSYTSQRQTELVGRRVIVHICHLEKERNREGQKQTKRRFWHGSRPLCTKAMIGKKPENHVRTVAITWRMDCHLTRLYFLSLR